METASSMATMVEALGMALPGNAAIPAVDSRRNRQAQITGHRIVAMVREDLCMSKILTRAAFENAKFVNAAVGGATNTVISSTGNRRPKLQLPHAGAWIS
jgi:dihydroxy-acid dehydratase